MACLSEINFFCFGKNLTHSVHLSSSRFNDSDHLKDPDLYSDKSDREGEQDHEESDPEGLEKSEESDSDTSERQDDSYIDLDPNDHLRETPYLEQSHEELGEVGWGGSDSSPLFSYREQPLTKEKKTGAHACLQL